MRRRGLTGIFIFGLAATLSGQAQAVHVIGVDPMVYRATLNAVDQANCHADAAIGKLPHRGHGRV